MAGLNPLGSIMLLVFGVLVIYILLASAMEYYHLHIMHESIIAILLGLVMSFLYLQVNETVVEVNEDVIIYFCLPPILFSLGYNMNKKLLFKSLGYSILYGIFGTLLQTLLTYLAIDLINRTDLIWVGKLLSSPYDHYEKRTLSTIDKVYIAAPLSSMDLMLGYIMISAKKFPQLYSVVFGEGMLNDSASFIIFKVLDDYIVEHKTMKYSALGELVPEFIKDISISIGFGILVGMACCFTFKYFRYLVKNIVHELAIMIFYGYCSYISAESFHYSGVISMLVTGVMMSHYNTYNMSHRAKIFTGFTFQTVSMICEGFMFTYLGLAIFAYGYQEWSLTLIAFMTLALIIVRFISIFTVSLVGIIIWKIIPTAKWQLSALDITIMGFCGLTKAGVAFALVLQVEDSTNFMLVRTTVFGVVLGTLLILSVISTRMIQWLLKIREKQMEAEDHPALKRTKSGKFVSAAKMRAQSAFQNFDETYLKPCLIYRYSHIQTTEASYDAQGRNVFGVPNETPHGHVNGIETQDDLFTGIDKQGRVIDHGGHDQSYGGTYGGGYGHQPVSTTEHH